MIQWTPYAFVRFVFAFIAGSIVSIYFPDGISGAAVKFLLIILIIAFILLAVTLHGKTKIIPGVIGLTSIVLAGYINVKLKTESQRADHFLHQNDSIKFYRAVISAYPEEKEKTWKVVATVSSIFKSRTWKPCTGKVLLYLSKNDFPSGAIYGEVLLIKGHPQLLQLPANPYEFDYKRFLSYRNIFHQHFLHRSDVHYLTPDPPSAFIDRAMKIRTWSNQVLKKYVTGAQEQAVASALVLGVTDGLDDDLLKAYSASGAMHVLAVSGLHVGIIYWILLLLLKPLRRYASGKWLLASISLVILWFYAFVTGLSPSVLRAVAMFSMVALAEPWGKRTNIYNTLAVSAFCLLLYDPYLIMSVGFQLSYLAVIGIVYLYPRMYNWWRPEGWLLDKVWQITAVAVAAQLVTFPVGLLYFHQFPVYFLFSNLVVIPLSFLVLILGLLLLALSFVGPAAWLVGFCLTVVIKGLNLGVIITELLPFSLINGVYITTTQCLLLMGMITAIVLVFVRRKFIYVGLAAAQAVVFFVIQLDRFITNSRTATVAVYKIPGHCAVDLISNGKAYFFADSALWKNDESIGFHIQPNRLVNGVRSVIRGESQPFVKDMPYGKLIVWKNITLLFLRKDFIFVRNSFIDYLIVSDNAVKDLTTVNEKFKFNQLIIDSSNSYYVSNKLLKQAEELKLPVHSVLHKGAFRIEI